MSNDANIARVYAFTKRLMQSCLHGASSYSTAVLLTLAEAMDSIPAIRTLLSANGIAEDDEDEMAIDGDENQKAKVYNVKEADPKKAHADSTSLWELSLLNNHYHPTVQSISCRFIENEPVSYKGNPFSDLKVIKFLDEFVFDRKRMLTQQKRQIKSRFFKDQRKTPFKIDVKAIQVPKNYEEMLQKRKVIPQHMQFLKKFTELKKDLDERVRKHNEKMKKKREKRKKKKLAIPVGSVDPNKDDEANGKYSYKNLAKAVDEDLDEMLVDTIMLENASDDEEEEEHTIAKRLANKEAISDEDDEDDVEMQEAQEEMSNIFEKEEERLLRKKQLKKKKK
jgi:ribosome biogenesis protein MAK21